MEKIQILSLINDFPIGDVPKNRNELISKAEIIAFLARFQEQFSSISNIDEIELMVKSLLNKALELDDGEKFPSLIEAERILGLVSGSTQDYNFIQYIKENNSNFNRSYNIIANNLGLASDYLGKIR